METLGRISLALVKDNLGKTFTKFHCDIPKAYMDRVGWEHARMDIYGCPKQLKVVVRHSFYGRPLVRIGKFFIELDNG